MIRYLILLLLAFAPALALAQNETCPRIWRSGDSLEKLELSENQLTDLPASIANLADTLQQLDLRGNPIPVERRAAI